MARHATPTQVFLVSTGPQRHVSNPSCNHVGLFGGDHTHCDVGLSAQEVAHGIARHQLNLNLWQGYAHLRQ